MNLAPAPVRPNEPRRPGLLRLKGNLTIRLPAVMGVLNVTPDSFSDGGNYFHRDRAIAHGLELIRAGADIVDVGGESTRPGAREVPVDEELARVIPVIEALAERARTPVSIDTRKAAVARAALSAGARIVNDVSGLVFDPAMVETVAEADAAVVIMHMRGTPQTMMRLARYRDVVAQVRRWLKARAAWAEKAGIKRSRIIVDPGLGFAKTANHNLALLAALPQLCTLGYPVLIGASRKSFIRRIAGADPAAVSYASAAVSALAVAAGASIVRVHEPGAARAAIAMASAMAGRRRR
jgi:dihydropteroate synthase